MAEKNNSVCSICGKGYYMCLSCRDYMTLSPWKIHTDTSEHYKIYQILHGYSTGVYDIDEAKSKLQMVDLTDKDSFRDNIKQLIDKIISHEVKATTTATTTVSKTDTESKDVVAVKNNFKNNYVRKNKNK